MQVAAFGGFWDYWELYHKVTFDGETKVITINPGETQINVEQDIYSAWKEWAMLYDYLKWEQAMRSTGGDELSGGQQLGSTFFLVNGWKIKIPHSVEIEGNLYSDDGSDPYITDPGVVMGRIIVSTLVEHASAPESDNARIFV